MYVPEEAATLHGSSGFFDVRVIRDMLATNSAAPHIGTGRLVLPRLLFVVDVSTRETPMSALASMRRRKRCFSNSEVVACGAGRQAHQVGPQTLHRCKEEHDQIRTNCSVDGLLVNRASILLFRERFKSTFPAVDQDLCGLLVFKQSLLLVDA